MLETTLNNNQVSFCIKDKNKHVLFQNKICIDICDDQQGKPCLIGCMALYEQDKTQQWKDKGSCVYKNKYMHGQYFDVTVLSDDAHLITFLQPLKEKHEAALSFYKNIGLTKKEYQIITAVIQSKSNQEICQLLSISKATLKTHLNNIYRKIRDNGLELKHLPIKRLIS